MASDIKPQRLLVNLSDAAPENNFSMMSHALKNREADGIWRTLIVSHNFGSRRETGGN
jgi:hypothetical protein